MKRTIQYSRARCLTLPVSYRSMHPRLAFGRLSCCRRGCRNSCELLLTVMEMTQQRHRYGSLNSKLLHARAVCGGSDLNRVSPPGSRAVEEAAGFPPGQQRSQKKVFCRAPGDWQHLGGQLMRWGWRMWPQHVNCCRPHCSDGCCSSLNDEKLCTPLFECHLKLTMWFSAMHCFLMEN